MILEAILNLVSSLLQIFRPTTIALVVPTLIILLNFEYVYKFTMWILRKIPFLGVE